MLKATPFHARTAPLVRAQTWRRWAGHQVASAYDPVPDHEYASIRNAAALIDISPLYKYRVRGRDATRMLDRVLTRDVTRCGIGRVLYSPWCDTHGKVIDDGTLSRLDADTYRLTAGDGNLRWLTMSARGFDVEIDDVSAQTAALALQGPLSRDILEHLVDDAPPPASAGGPVAGAGGIRDLRYFRLAHVTVRGFPVTISRTGYTGDLGYELWVDADRAIDLWDALIEVGTPFGITPAGIWALDIARIEAGLVMMDVDYHSAQRAMIEDQKSSPFELNLGWTVSAGKGPFTGRRALLAERECGPAWGFTGLVVQWDSFEALHASRGLAPHVPSIAWRTSAPVYRGREQIGYATSGCWSPLLKQYLALAHLRAPHFAPGTAVRLEMTVEHERKQADAEVQSLPFFNPERKRA